MSDEGTHGKWEEQGRYWFCGCHCPNPLLRFYFGGGIPWYAHKQHSPNVSRCRKCGTLRPLKRDNPGPINDPWRGLRALGRLEKL